MKFLADIQNNLELTYGVRTGLDVTEFVRVTKDFSRLGELIVSQEQGDLNLALLFDRDVLAAWESSAKPELRAREASVPFEEVSHFVYLAFNHARGRNVTAIEMEMQSEVDRILLAFHGSPGRVGEQTRSLLLKELFEGAYSSLRYEESRTAAAKFLKQLSGGDPRAWSDREFELLRKFFHSDLAEKLHLSRER